MGQCWALGFSFEAPGLVRRFVPVVASRCVVDNGDGCGVVDAEGTRVMVVTGLL
jgi:hypothetical protein